MNTVSFVFQDSKLLKMSIFDNVRMGNKNAMREEVIEALHNAQCDDIIEKLPGGIDTVIGSKEHIFPVARHSVSQSPEPCLKMRRS